jgi:hypothetical protein
MATLLMTELRRGELEPISIGARIAVAGLFADLTRLGGG